MDHLPYPENSGLPPVDVPYCCHDIPQYDGLGFPDFPARYGWESAGRRWYEHHDSKTVVGRAQSWLYFGLLKEFLGPSFEIEAFVREYSDFSNSETVTSLPLPALLRSYRRRKRPVWFRYWFGLGERLPFNEKMALVTTLKEVENFSNTMAIHHTESAEAVELSITCLLWSLRNAAINKDVSIGKRSTLRMPESYPRLLTNRFQLAGHCPSQTKSLFSGQFSAATLYYLSGLSFQESAHHECNAYSCVDNNIDNSTYTTKHVDADCSCDFYGVDSDGLATIIRNGQIPVVELTVTNRAQDRKPFWSRGRDSGTNNANSLQPEDEDNRKLKVRLAEGSSSGFHAISHVWAHGLGNPHETALPRCQLLRIVKKVSDCEHSSPLKRLCGTPDKMVVRIWMDTLCVPPGKHRRDVRKQAISQMDSVFIKARSILILDQTLSNSTCDTQDLAAFCTGSVLISPWMTRCWTFHEACLAQGWTIVFQGILYHVYDALNSVEKAMWAFDSFSAEWTDNLQLIKELSRQVVEFVDRHWLREDDTGHEYFCTTWNQLITRSTSHNKDVHFILGNLLGLQVSEIVNLKHSERTKAILNAQSALPLSLLFTADEDAIGPTGRKCKWVPLDINGYMQDSTVMKKDSIRGGFQIDLNQSNVLAIQVDQPRFDGDAMTLEDEFGNTIQCQFSTRMTDVHGMTGIILLFTDFTKKEEGVGACLKMSTEFTRQVDRMVATFVSTFTYLKYSTASPETNSSLLDMGQLATFMSNRSTRLPPTTSILLDCGKQYRIQPSNGEMKANQSPDLAQWPVLSHRQIRDPQHLRADMLRMNRYCVNATIGLGVLFIIVQIVKNSLEGALLPFTIGAILLYALLRLATISLDATLVVYSKLYLSICNEAWCNSIATETGKTQAFGPWSWRFLQSWKLLLVEFLIGSLIFIFCWPVYNTRWFGIAGAFLAIEVVLRVMGEYPARILSARRHNDYPPVDSKIWVRTMHMGIIFFPEVLSLKLLSSFRDPMAFPEGYKRSGLLNTEKWELWLGWICRILS